MFLAHSIRLRDPWQCERFDDGATRYSRTFHKPTGLEHDDELWLVLSGLPAEAQVTVNGHTFAAKGATGILPVPEVGANYPQNHSVPTPQSAIPNPQSGSRLPARFNVTLILTETNRIEILIPPASSLQPPASSFPFDARLAIMARS